MRLSTEFVRLPLRFDAARLAEEIAQFEEADWRPHPEGHPGNSALALVAVNGDPHSDAVKGPMRATPHLARCPYIQEVLASLRAPVGRTRLMRIDGNAEATPHVDSNYYWMQRVRVHVPVVTDPAVTFVCGDASVHMAAGEAWIFDTSKRHNVLNPNPTRRVHLVCDTVGSPEFWEMVDEGIAPPRAAAPHRITFEAHNFPVVMSPMEQSALVELLYDVPPAVSRFLDDWRELWHQHGESRHGWAAYRALLDEFDEALEGHPQRQAIRQALIHPALNPELAARVHEPVARPRRIDRPVFIISPPRAGSTMLFHALWRSPSVFTIGAESHELIEGLEPLHPAQHGWESNRLTAADATPVIASVLETRFLAELRARDGSRRIPPRVRMLEKTSKNLLRIPFLHALYPDACFIYLYRDPRATISSLIDVWRSQTMVSYPDLPGWEGPLQWTLTLVPGWRELVGKSVEEIAAHQWTESVRVMLDDFETLDPGSWCVASYDALVAEPQKELERLCAFAEIAWDREVSELPVSRATLTPPSADKWRRNGEAIDRVFDRVAPVAERARELFARAPAVRARVAPPRAAAPHRDQPLRSVHTNTLPEILKSIRASLAVSTYQSGRVVLVRRDGDVANTHFLSFENPMGIAVANDRLAISTATSICDFRHSPAVAKRLQPEGKHDACFIPRNEHITGDVRVHEIAFGADGALWMVNTRFSALCTLDEDNSFVPRWSPPFISELAPEDRCHLNGLAMVAGRPRLVTVLGETNTPGGWRPNKAAGGALIDVDSGTTIVRGLSAPHSPRWYAGKIWLLESGKGTLISIDTQAGRVETVAQFPGFTRGLAFAEHYAFVGLSQVRERVFDGLPLSKRIRLDERSCGVWAVDLRNGNIAGFLKFEDAVQEIFDVQVLHGMEFPELLDARSELVRGHYEMPSAQKPAFAQ